MLYRVGKKEYHYLVKEDLEFYLFHLLWDMEAKPLEVYQQIQC
jgi:hypothetical protein